MSFSINPAGQADNIQLPTGLSTVQQYSSAVTPELIAVLTVGMLVVGSLAYWFTRSVPVVNEETIARNRARIAAARKHSRIRSRRR